MSHLISGNFADPMGAFQIFEVLVRTFASVRPLIMRNGTRGGSRGSIACQIGSGCRQRVDSAGAVSKPGCLERYDVPP
jgi:hypothetical protein